MMETPHGERRPLFQKYRIMNHDCYYDDDHNNIRFYELKKFSQFCCMLGRSISHVIKQCTAYGNPLTILVLNLGSQLTDFCLIGIIIVKVGIEISGTWLFK